MSEILNGGRAGVCGRGYAAGFPWLLEPSFRSAISSVTGASFHCHYPRLGLVRRHWG